MKKTTKIIAYRRRCNLEGQGTGLSHYILLTPKTVKK
jgi:modified peptide precursor CbpA